MLGFKNKQTVSMLLAECECMILFTSQDFHAPWYRKDSFKIKKKKKGYVFHMHCLFGESFLEEAFYHRELQASLPELLSHCWKDLIPPASATRVNRTRPPYSAVHILLPLELKKPIFTSRSGSSPPGLSLCEMEMRAQGSSWHCHGWGWDDGRVEAFFFSALCITLAKPDLDLEWVLHSICFFSTVGQSGFVKYFREMQWGPAARVISLHI